MNLRLKRVRKKNGRVYVYRSDLPVLVPLPAHLPENHPEFIRAYLDAEKIAAAAKPKSRAKPGSIAALVEAWWQAPEFKRLAPSTRENFRRVASRIAEERGKALLRDLRPDHLRRDLRAFTPGAASNRFKVWRSMLRFAVDAGLLTVDPSIGVRPPRAETRPHRQWTEDEVAAYRAHWPVGTPQRLAFEVIAWTAARCVDAVKLGNQAVGPDGWLRFVQQKTGQHVALPITANLPSWASPMEADRMMLLECLPRDRMLWIVTQTGAPRSVKGLSQWLSASAKQAGLPDDCTAHGLRKYRAARLAEIGATPHQIGAWIGDVSLGMVSHYTRAADRKSILLGTEQDRNLGNRTGKVSKMPIKAE